MHRIDTPTAQRDKFGERKNGFTRGNPQTGTPATQLDYLYCDAIQEEIANAIELAGIKLDKSKHNQLATAIKELVSKGSVKLNSSTNSSSETEAATPKAVKSAYDTALSAQQTANTAKSTAETNASTTTAGRVKLNSAVNSASETEAATSRAVKTVNDNVSNAHARINDTNNSISNITDRLRYLNASSQLWTANKRYVFAVRDDAAAGVFDVVDEKFVWCFNGTGLCAGSVDTSFIKGLDQFVRDRTLPVGIPQPWPKSTPPDGWLKCNGWKFDKNKYPKLAAAYPSGILPELRGEFIRGWDDGRGVDTSREMLSWQGDAIRNISGTFVGTVFTNSTCSGAFFAREQMDGHLALGNTGWKDRLNYTFDASRVVPTANENRPRNIAFMYIVKAE